MVPDIIVPGDALPPVASYPAKWSFVFSLGPLHWSSICPTSREHRNIVQLCTSFSSAKQFENRKHCNQCKQCNTCIVRYSTSISDGMFWLKKKTPWRSALPFIKKIITSFWKKSTESRFGFSHLKWRKWQKPNLVRNHPGFELTGPDLPLTDREIYLVNHWVARRHRGGDGGKVEKQILDRLKWKQAQQSVSLSDKLA